MSLKRGYLYDQFIIALTFKFSDERIDNFTNFLNKLFCSKAFCCWSTKLFQSLDHFDKTESFVCYILVEFQQVLLLSMAK